MGDITIRAINPSEYHILEEFIYQAIFIPEGQGWPERDIIYLPEIYIYVKDFGGQRGDHGIVAELDNKVIGAAWTRIIPAYGHLDDDTPELAISTFPEYRNHGVGTKMMQALFEVLRENGYKQTSLSVQKNNPAVRFYLKLGYEITGERIDFADHEDYLMKYEL